MDNAGDLPSGSNDGGSEGGSEDQNLHARAESSTSAEEDSAKRNNEEGNNNNSNNNNDNRANERPMENVLNWLHGARPVEPIREIPEEPAANLNHAHELQPIFEQLREPSPDPEEVFVNNAFYDEDEDRFGLLNMVELLRAVESTTYEGYNAPLVTYDETQRDAFPGEGLRVDEDEGAFGMGIFFNGDNLEDFGAGGGEAGIQGDGFRAEQRNPRIVAYVTNTVEAYRSQHGEEFCDFLSLRHRHVFELSSVREYTQVVRELCDNALLAEAMINHINCVKALMSRNLETAVYHQRVLVEILYDMLHELYVAGEIWTFAVLQTANYELQVVMEKAAQANSAFEIRPVIRVQWAFIHTIRFWQMAGCPCHYLQSYRNRRYRRN